MDKKSRIMSGLVIFVICVVGVLFVFGDRDDGNKGDSANIKRVQIIVYDKEEKVVFDKKTETNSTYLIDFLKSFKGIDVTTEEGEYGEFIVSINGIEQGDNYYWNFYVNGKYSSVGASSYEIRNNDEITFKLEKFE